MHGNWKSKEQNSYTARGGGNKTFKIRHMESIYRPSDFANQSVEKDVSWLKAELTFGTGGRPSLSKCNAPADVVAIRAEGANLD